MLQHSFPFYMARVMWDIRVVTADGERCGVTQVKCSVYSCKEWGLWNVEEKAAQSKLFQFHCILRLNATSKALVGAFAWVIMLSGLFFFFPFLFFCHGRCKSAYFPPASFQIVYHKEAAKFPKLLVLWSGVCTAELVLIFKWCSWRSTIAQCELCNTMLAGLLMMNRAGG